MLRYASTAGALGLGWFAVLLIPGLTREWLLDNVPQNVACLTVASVVVALGAADSSRTRTRRSRIWSGLP